MIDVSKYGFVVEARLPQVETDEFHKYDAIIMLSESLFKMMGVTKTVKEHNTIKGLIAKGKVFEFWCSIDAYSGMPATEVSVGQDRKYFDDPQVLINIGAGPGGCDDELPAVTADKLKPHSLIRVSFYAGHEACNSGGCPQCATLKPVVDDSVVKVSEAHQWFQSKALVIEHAFAVRAKAHSDSEHSSVGKDKDIAAGIRKLGLA